MAGDDEVGYRRPPRRTRFRPGRSGNPAGRRKGPQTLPADLRAELAEDVTLREGEVERTVTRQRAILRSLTAKAIEGDAKATALVLDLIQRLIGAAPEPDAESEPGPDPRSARARLAARIAKVHARIAAAGARRRPRGPESDEPEPGEPESGNSESGR